MKIIPYISVDTINFTDSYEEVKAKLEFDFEESESEDIDAVYPMLYVEETNMLIQFSEEGESVRYVELLSPKFDAFCGDALITGSYIDVLKQTRELDEALDAEDGGFTSIKLGVAISRQSEDGLYSNKVESVVVFSKAFSEEQDADPDDFLTFHLGYNPFEGDDK
ncbi:hypothetical protein R1T16_14445 [Flavobacterium sp. DG1-102-2]|uniref:hypothetical protein n=1 Tax=Flavobacterium sp. DG1-102-2 TaxID=3081663 RepID=UPI002949048F|nr:hypothetical protein [Flavobacterium sp. DG1-102-2]MDV6169633.1 hypothetical protein [Flavobacterium sp. DG1-102-2]